VFRSCDFFLDFLSLIESKIEGQAGVFTRFSVVRLAISIEQSSFFVRYFKFAPIRNILYKCADHLKIEWQADLYNENIYHLCKK